METEKWNLREKASAGNIWPSETISCQFIKSSSWLSFLLRINIVWLCCISFTLDQIKQQKVYWYSSKPTVGTTVCSHTCLQYHVSAIIHNGLPPICSPSLFSLTTSIFLPSEISTPVYEATSCMIPHLRVKLNLAQKVFLSFDGAEGMCILEILQNRDDDKFGLTCSTDCQRIHFTANLQCWAQSDTTVNHTAVSFFSVSSKIISRSDV